MQLFVLSVRVNSATSSEINFCSWRIIALGMLVASGGGWCG